ncbi:hypothetical protein OIO90_003129 [Microbotryomycetes sp. JL221]|nr:hypothetical protein OIO90_003129 [Microbotryomycetes sp. JL221]
MTVAEAPLRKQVSTSDSKEHYGVIILGAGVSGLAETQAWVYGRDLLPHDDECRLCSEKSDEIGGTWNHNRYPGAACDIPMSLYSFSFAPPYNIKTQWAGQAAILRYLHEVQEKFKVYNIAFKTMATEASFSRDSGLWTVKVKDLETNKERVRTCNILISAVGGLANPNLPPFDPSLFDGPVFHSAEWDQSVSLENKNVVVVGNGCSAAQVVPDIQHQVAKVTQVARSRQSILRRPPTPDGYIIYLLKKYLPGFALLLRAMMFFMMESHFKVSDIRRGRRMRDDTLQDTEKYIRETAPEHYWDVLQPDFAIATKRRVFDMGYYEALNNPKVELVADDSVESAKGNEVITKKGKRIPADVIVLCTGFRTQEFLFPLKVKADGVSLQERLKETNVANYQGTCVAGFPNYFWLMGPNTATGHSSVIFTSECQIEMMLTLVKPILNKIRKIELRLPAPTVEVSSEAQARYNESVRVEMKNKVWEQRAPGANWSWYVDPHTGLCTTLYPWSQVHFWWKTSWGLNKRDFRYENL